MHFVRWLATLAVVAPGVGVMWEGVGALLGDGHFDLTQAANYATPAYVIIVLVRGRDMWREHRQRSAQLS